MKREIKSIIALVSIIIFTAAGYIIFGRTKNTSPMIKNATNTEDKTFFGSKIGDLRLFDSAGNIYNMENLAGKNAVFFFNEGLMCYPSCWRQISFFAADPRFQKGNIVAAAVVVDNQQDWQKEAVARMPELSKTLTLFDRGGVASELLGLLDLESSMHKGEFPGHSYVLVDKTGTIREILDDPKMGINNDVIIEKISKF